ncbi:hypothetical protein [Amycolatopsis saalfeldensis]|uniref:Uncharacterized protein n=1 Tax=Amycolatopsis saalfeldensis TaxID=394193 RepID=A0A1H8VY75_9PSEU|nr:hypothetical protein [Amycolatopsis saalfeldensis]SEP20290.1 hypothetical protein SAMN04489732_104385 [Amycolatopsis saalfeldensis]
MDPAERSALTALCAELPELRAECARRPEPARVLAVIEAEARARRPITALLEQLLGTPSDETVRQRSLSSRLPGSGPGRADEERFGCPDGACDRLAAAEPAGPVPRCPLTGDRLKPV